MLDVQVPPVGPRDALIAFVGEAPGKNEVIKKEPFVGRAGKLFKSTLKKAGIEYRDCYVTNVVKRRPAPNSNNFHHIPGDELALWTEALHEELSSLQSLQLLIPMGNNALRAILNLEGITNHRGSL